MSKRDENLRLWAMRLMTARLQMIIIAIVAVVVALVMLHYCTRGDHAEIAHTENIDPTPVQIAKIRSIGQWEFLSVSDEELVDTVRKGFFDDDELARIYYGTLRLGIDLQEAGDDLLTLDGDTLQALLPPVKLLDQNLLDEARTKTFYEDGRWTEADRKALTERARQQMLRRCMTPSNLRSAEQNATIQVGKMLEAMGYKYVRVRFKRGNDLQGQHNTK